MLQIGCPKAKLLKEKIDQLDFELIHFESFSQRVNFRSFRVAFRSSRLRRKPLKIRLFRP